MQEKVEEVYASWINWIERNFRTSGVGSFLLPVLLVIGVYLLVYLTGGIKYVYSHSMYLAIIFAALSHGARGGAVIGILGGIALGPLMP